MYQALFISGLGVYLLFRGNILPFDCHPDHRNCLYQCASPHFYPHRSGTRCLLPLDRRCGLRTWQICRIAKGPWQGVRTEKINIRLQVVLVQVKSLPCAASLVSQRHPLGDIRNESEDGLEGLPVQDTP